MDSNRIVADLDIHKDKKIRDTNTMHFLYINVQITLPV